MISRQELQRPTEYNPDYEWDSLIREFGVKIHRYLTYVTGVFGAMEDGVLKQTLLERAKKKYRRAKSYYKQLKGVAASQDPERIEALASIINIEANPLDEDLQTLQEMTNALNIEIRGLKH
jgi:excinuclease UvrABC ATPase subunit